MRGGKWEEGEALRQNESARKNGGQKRDKDPGKQKVEGGGKRAGYGRWQRAVGRERKEEIGMKMRRDKSEKDRE